MTEKSTQVEVKKTTPTTAASQPLGALRARWDSLFDDFFADFPFPRWPSLRRPLDIEPLRRLTGGDLMPAVDIKEQDGRYVISAELPGMDEKDISVEVQDDVLTLRGEKRAEREEKDKGYHLTERSYGSFTRSFQLPADADAGKASATFSKGVLSINVPMSAEAQSKVKKIDVKSS
ncbi:Hsp20/alpha crystallin family protein [Immundisolibacter sp.]